MIKSFLYIDFIIAEMKIFSTIYGRIYKTRRNKNEW